MAATRPTKFPELLETWFYLKSSHNLWAYLFWVEDPLGPPINKYPRNDTKSCFTPSFELYWYVFLSKPSKSIFCLAPFSAVQQKSWGESEKKNGVVHRFKAFKSVPNLTVLPNWGLKPISPRSSAYGIHTVDVHCFGCFCRRAKSCLRSDSEFGSWRKQEIRRLLTCHTVELPLLRHKFMKFISAERSLRRAWFGSKMVRSFESRSPKRAVTGKWSWSPKNLPTVFGLGGCPSRDWNSG